MPWFLCSKISKEKWVWWNRYQLTSQRHFLWCSHDINSLSILSAFRLTCDLLRERTNENSCPRNADLFFIYFCRESHLFSLRRLELIVCIKIPFIISLSVLKLVSVCLWRSNTPPCWHLDSASFCWWLVLPSTLFHLTVCSLFLPE